MKTAFNSWAKNSWNSVEPYFSLRSPEPLCSKMDEAFPSAVSFQQMGLICRRHGVCGKRIRPLLSRLKLLLALASRGESCGGGTLWGTLNSVSLVLLLWLWAGEGRTQLSTCPSFLPLPWGEAELTQAAPALPDVLGAPPWAGIGSVWDGLVPKTELFSLPGCTEIPLERDRDKGRSG